MTDIFEEKLYLLTGVCLFALFILSAVGLGSPAWRIGRYGSEQNVEAGLITRCYHDLVTSEHRCSPFMLGSQTGKLTHTQFTLLADVIHVMYDSYRGGALMAKRPANLPEDLLGHFYRRFNFEHVTDSLA
ncbi:hypothetical protein PoB_005205100 [Plakobranchus ocellatus]|uniref:Uncharacterized protein n=1 Tax=Plakobranchus ocellatus TaxID=259542 RepID=A0AAV4C2E0_9GAST|nr:hypothetical protein PoB_005205100 [Plakobranchus ocellatus]